MNISEEFQAKVVAYLQNELSNQERIDFEKQLRINPDLEDALREQKFIDSQLFEENDWELTEFSKKEPAGKQYFEFYTDQKNQAFFQSLKNIQPKTDEKHIQDEKSPFRLRKVIRYVSAIAAVFILFAIVYQQTSTTINGSKLYAKYVEYDSLEGFIQKSEATSFDKAQHLFEQKEFAEAIAIFEKIKTQGKSNDLSQIYLALSLAETEQFEFSLQNLQPILNNNNSLQQANALWYAGLISLKANQNQKAKEYFERYLTTNDKIHSKKASKLIKKLKQTMSAKGKD